MHINSNCTYYMVEQDSCIPYNLGYLYQSQLSYECTKYACPGSLKC